MKELQKAIRGKKCLLFIDLEGTQLTHEMIEIGAYKVLLRDDLTVKKIFKPYHAYVLAKHRVGPIVTKLTGITDLKLKKEGIPFRLVQQQIKKYMGKDYEEAILVSYGTEDAHIILSSAENNMDASVDDARFLARRFLDFADFLARFVRDPNGNTLSLTNALHAYGVEFEGTAHSAQADAYNLFLLFKAFKEKPEITKEHYKNTLAVRGHVAPPIQKVIRALSSGKTVTPEDWDAYVLEALQ
ncbi:MAG: exonuclease domain-containing protein [Bacilli bacterium]|nr:exonuclease domain-containing protein [Bacilli bacterium]